MKKISIIIPAYNEGRNLKQLADNLRPLLDNELTSTAYDWSVVLINDGSTDNSLDIMQQLRHNDLRYNYIDLSRNFGKESAMLAGLDYASGDAVVIIDADMQHPIDVIPKMVSQWEQGYDDVYGRRISRSRESWLRKRLTAVYYSLLKHATKIDILPNVGDFRLLDRQCINALRELRETQRYSKGLFSWIGFRKKEIEFEPNDRYAGKSSFTYRRLFSLALDGITSFTTAPLRFASLTGILTALASLVYLVYILCKTLLYGDPVSGFPTLMCVILFLGGCQLIALGIIGEYIARIFNEAKHRPPYIVKTHNGESKSKSVSND